MFFLSSIPDLVLMLSIANPSGKNFGKIMYKNRVKTDLDLGYILSNSLPPNINGMFPWQAFPGKKPLLAFHSDNNAYAHRRRYS
jgi:hypothetical protein